MATGGVDFSEFMDEHARIESELQNAGYSATYIIKAADKRRERGHYIAVFVTGDDIGSEIMKLLDFIESKEPKFGIKLLVYRPGRLDPTLAFVPAKQDKK